MAFLSIVYGIFFLSILGLYWSVEGRSLRLWVLLISSLVFYSSLQIQYIPLLIVMILITFRLGIALSTPLDWRAKNNEAWQFAQQDWNRRRFKLLWLGIILNLTLLIGFKYIPFLLESVGAILQLPTIQTSADWFKTSLIAPLGISFFCFECIAYLVDVYRGAPATYDFLKFSAYKLFFPKLISGPITRFHPLAAQFKEAKFPTTQQITEGLWLIACGAIKKLLLADHLATLVNLTFGSLERAGSGDLWLAIFAYGLQLYLDFSGYVDVARGCAILLGCDLPQNFNFPYLTTNIADFWRRWHITLGDWLRNYLYFPLGGSRKGLQRTCFNLVLVMFLAGIWHGAAWGFIVWGLLHGLFLVAHRLTDTVSKQWIWLGQFWKSIPGALFSWALTQTMVFLAWVYFRLPNLKDANLVMSRLWGHLADVQFAQKVYVETLNIGRLHLTLLLLGLVGGMAIAYLFQRSLKLQLNWHIKILLVPLCLFFAWLLAPNESPPYIYFDF
jgi:alginate O-acetyltransferase complex protein AlgI